VLVKEGRFGPYVTAGEVNASLRKGDTVEGITLERAAELLEDRRVKLASEPAKKGRKAAPAKKKSAKKKGATAKAGAKKQGARKKKAPAAETSAGGAGGATPSA
jgi:DNA topoisomerase I